MFRMSLPLVGGVAGHKNRDDIHLILVDNPLGVRNSGQSPTRIPLGGSHSWG